MTASESRPSFPFYGREFYSSPRIRCLTAAQRGGRWVVSCGLVICSACRRERKTLLRKPFALAGLLPAKREAVAP